MNYLVTDEQLTATADAIREKTGGTDLITWDESKGFSDAVSGISAGGGGENKPSMIIDEVTSGAYIKSVSLNNFERIYSRMFYTDSYSTSYLENVDFSKSEELNKIGDNSFYGCTNLALTSLPDTVKNIDQRAFYKCTNLALTSLPDDLEIVSNEAFYDCTNLALTSLPENCSYYGSSAFSGCANIEISSVSDIMEIIPTSMFNGCTKITSLDLRNVRRINTSSFRNTTLSTIILRKSDGICELANVNAFDVTPFASGGTGGTAYVPSALIETYQNATNWSTLYAAGTCNFVAIEGSEYE